MTIEKTKKIFISGEVYQQLADHAKQKGITVDQEVEELLQVAIKAIEAQYALKTSCKGAEFEL